MNEITPYQAAVQYINMGLAVFPLRYKDKVPLTRNGCTEATTDAAIVKGWWQKWPNANVGIATGSKSGGLVVIDLDIDEDKGLDGYHSLRDWEREHGELPDTWQSITGRGGYHLFFRTEKQMQNKVGMLDGVDIRAEGGYVVAPPSVHMNGNKYEWEQAPDEFQLAEANDLVIEFLSIKKQSELIGAGGFKAPEIIQSGGRNSTMYKFACSLQSKGLTDEAIIAAMRIENEQKCVPPLDDDELLKTINSALRHEKGVTTKQLPKTQDNEPVKTNSTYQVAMMLDRNEKGKTIQSIDNVCTILRNDPNLIGKLKYNILSYSPFIYGSVPWEQSDNYREWSNTDDSNLKCYIESKYGISNMEKVMEALNIVVNENRFNPVIDYLEQLKWDGKPRIENLLPDYLGVEKTEYATECMRLFMFGAISRAYYPGCKFDYMPVLVGEQGMGKSTFFKLLAGNDNWYNDNFNTVDGDKATEKLRGMWIVELAELLAVKNAQAVESIKAFITSTIDTYRPPYGRRTEQRPRICVFAGTTNSNHFLTDATGNRRYLPLLVSKARVKKSMFDDLENVRNDFQQAWAEALHIFNTEKPKLILPKHLESDAVAAQNKYVEEDSRVGIIQAWLDGCREEQVCVAMLYQIPLGFENKIPTRRESNEIHNIMQHSITGWEPAKTKTGKRNIQNYGVQICYDKIKEPEKPIEQVESDGFIKIDEQIELPFP